MVNEPDILAAKEAQALRDLWQGRVLAHTRGQPLGAVVISVLAHSYDEAMPVMLAVVFPGFAGLKPPGLISAGKIEKNGIVVADIVKRDGMIVKDAALFKNELQMRDAFRRLADEMKLNDADRIELFRAVQRWVVADRRLDPSMDPSDPEAKRLVH